MVQWEDETMAPEPIVPPSLLVIPALSRHREALCWAEAQLQVPFGPIAMVSADFSFHYTHYYETEMGAGLLKRFLVFERLVESDTLAETKQLTISLEQQLAREGGFPEARPLNLDPGLLQLGKFCLATTKDKDHRIYLRNGIYAEVTLRFQDGEYRPWPWTYADYREPAVLNFLQQARDFYRPRLRAWRLERMNDCGEGKDSR